ncbi:Conserved exported protein of uncharacterised function [Mycobacteroides abscessus subsp. abscessus]|uniref:DUF5642 family protein n=1 Tax=Mycobacteroides abscessus TaxID=36809 RepID=UPI0009A79CE5|nr:DUF5642 family protein [Mycobacteroides abscessus]SKV13482.1 Conserved exported protein of uncharacterised function [Mycobacteroides abscessus subsp. abscessus]SKY59729.1 Conserved exported protein of uncharacterised function [Mycobacteroides abscessus subsp. abscessus]
MLKPVTVKSWGIWAICALAAVVVAGCGRSVQNPVNHNITIGNIVSLQSEFGPEFAVKTMKPAGMDPKLLSPAPLPPGVTVDPPDCAKYSGGSAVPAELKGNMAALTATGAGNQYVAVAVETSQEVPFDPAVSENCKKVGFRGNGIAGQTEVIDAPSIDGARTLGMKRDVLSGTSGRAIGQEVLNYSAYLGRYMVVVTVSPIAVGKVPPAMPDGKRASDLLVKAVAAVRS